MILRRFSVFSEGFNEHYVFDKVIEGVREEYGFEDKDDALRQCKLLNNKSHRNSFFNTNKKIIMTNTAISKPKIDQNALLYLFSLFISI